LPENIVVQAFTVFPTDLRKITGDGVQPGVHQRENLIVQAPLLRHVQHNDRLTLTVAVQSADPLHESHRVPRQVVVHEDVAPGLQVEALTACFGRHQKLPLGLEPFDGLPALFHGLPAVNDVHGTE